VVDKCRRLTAERAAQRQDKMIAHKTPSDDRDASERRLFEKQLTEEFFLWFP